MRIFCSPLILISWLTMAFILSGCLGLSPKTDPSHYYSMNASPENEATVNDSDVSVGLIPVEVPSYLNRTPILIRKGDHEISVSQLHRWAEPLDKGIHAVLAESIAHDLHTRSIPSSFWTQTSPPQFVVAISFQHFEATDDNEVVMSANWRLTRSSDGKEIASRIEIIKRPCTTTPPDYEEIVSALGDCLRELSGRICDGIRKAQ